MMEDMFFVRATKKIDGKLIEGLWRGRRWKSGETGPFGRRDEALGYARIHGGVVVTGKESWIVNGVPKELPVEETKAPEVIPVEPVSVPEPEVKEAVDLETIEIPEGHKFPKYNDMLKEMKNAGFDYQKWYGPNPKADQMERIYWHFQNS